MSCRAIAPLLEPFLDGELQPEKVMEIEQHLAECHICVERVRLGQAVRTSLRRAARASAEPSEAFRARLSSALEASRRREWEVRELEQQVERTRMLSWRTILPVAVAAGLTLVFAASTNTEQHRAQREAGQYAHVDQANADALLEELVERHLNARPEVTSPTLVPELEQEVGVPVRIPSLTQYGAHWEGGSVVPVRNQRAASLRYKLAGHRVTLYVYDSSRIPIEHRLERRLVGDAPVYVGTRHGYSIGATEHRGVGYALASDLNDAETAELVAALY